MEAAENSGRISMIPPKKEQRNLHLVNDVIAYCEAIDRIKRNDCGFWKKDNSGYYAEEFADMLKRKFE